ncbi:MAG: flagellar basal body P-ring protein FlgI, partial [Planctomycetota bacterium]
MSPNRGRWMVILAAAVLALGAPIAEGTTIQNLVRLKGLERNVLVGLGIVVGLNGTGDESKSSYVAARPFAELLRNMGNSVQNLEELVEADSYALVKVTMQIPATGARSGDELKVEVSAMFNASSLAGGELVMSPLRLPLPNGFKLQTMAFARGTIEVMKDNPRRGAIEAGGQMVTDVRTSPVTPDGTMTLVLRPEVAGYPVATLIARTINYEFSLDGSTQIARVEDPSNIRIYLPLAERDDSASFISTLMTIP